MKKESASAPKLAPASEVTSSSTISASIAPLTPPAGSIEPRSAACASVVGWPASSNAQPSGIGLPCFAATMILPRATSDNDRSITTGAWPRRGNTAAMGLVPNSGRRPPQPGIAAGELPMAMPTMPTRATASSGSAAAPKWWLLVTAATPAPVS
ncbi:hypothetical protein D9M71_690640 [compost metagenome]